MDKLRYSQGSSGIAEFQIRCKISGKGLGRSLNVVVAYLIIQPTLKLRALLRRLKMPQDRECSWGEAKGKGDCRSNLPLARKILLFSYVPSSK